MKNIFCAISLLTALSVHASIDYTESDDSAKATPVEIATSRACFNEVAEQGCGVPGVDDEHFHSCLMNVRATLTDNCKLRMTELYGKK